MTPGRPSEAAMRWLAAAALVLAGLAALDGFEALHVVAFQLGRNDTPSPLFNALVYTAACLAGAFGILVALCHRPLVRRVTAVVVLLLASIQLGFAAVNESGFTHHEAALLFSESEFAPDALRFFANRFALAILLLFAAGSGAVWLLGRYGPRLRSWAWLGVPIASLVGSNHVIDRTSGKVYQFPAPIRVALLTAWAWEHRLPHYAEREPTRFGVSGPPLADHIVLVVDESVNGHSLGINGAPVDTTPWLSSRPDGFFNYGIASAISNLSSSSNLVLQTGLPSRPSPIASCERCARPTCSPISPRPATARRSSTPRATPTGLPT